MNSRKDSENPGAAPVEITPVSFRPGHEPKRSRSLGFLKGLLGLGLGASLILLCASAWFVFTARQVVIRIDPKPDHLSINGGMIAPKIGDHYLMRPGDYVLKAVKECFQPLQNKLTVTAQKTQDFKFMMTRQPGRLSFQAHQADVPAVKLTGALILIDGRQRGHTPLTGLEVKPGRRSVVARAENFQDLHTEIDVAGCNEVQQFDLALVPGWAEISLLSEPAGASVLADGKAAGTTPMTLKLMAGHHDLEVQAERFKSWHTRLAVVANQPQELETIRLQPADGRLSIRTEPDGAQVMIGETFAGQTPLELTLTANEPHRIHLSKAGYEKADRTVKLLSEE